MADDGRVRPRYDGAGDGWAKEHREALGNKYYLQDFDGLAGNVAFTQNTQDRLFAEYVPDDYRNRQSAIRRFAYVCFFDRKKSHDALHHSSSNLCLAVYLDLCRKLAKSQPIAPKFFYIIGGDSAPWDIRNVDIYTGKMDEDYRELNSASWESVWALFGLAQMRRELERWILQDDNEGDGSETSDEPSAVMGEKKMVDEKLDDEKLDEPAWKRIQFQYGVWRCQDCNRTCMKGLDDKSLEVWLCRICGNTRPLMQRDKSQEIRERVATAVTDASKENDWRAVQWDEETKKWYCADCNQYCKRMFDETGYEVYRCPQCENSRLCP